jgi:uncharacterized protein
MINIKKNKLLINVLSLPYGKSILKKELSPQDLELNHLEFCGPINVSLELFKSNKAVRVSGAVDFCLILECVNCLEKFKRQFSEKIYQEYIKIEPYRIPFSEELEETDFIREYYTTDFFDVAPLIHDIIILAIPIAPWCQENCPGVK